MSYLPAVLIKKKRDGLVLTDDEIAFFVTGFATQRIPEYQMAALLMAIVLKGMNKVEAAALTRAMLHSGEVLSFEGMKYLPVDKHSTGGIGDKTSLLIAPIVAACDVPVPMIAGRGLGHTGGTLDKLESIPGFNINLSLRAFKEQVQSLGCAIIGQTKEICPADKKMYALRDVTGTVESIALICGSILSKKIAEGIKGLVMDVKYGSGAFMKTAEDAEELALWLAETAQRNGVKTTAYITNMEEPLGCFVGNAIEVLECLSVFTNKPVLGFEPSQFADMRELSLTLAAEMLWLAGRSEDLKAARQLAEEKLSSGEAYRMFEKMVAAQGGRLEEFNFPENLNWRTVTAASDGYIAGYNSENIGLAAISLGAGRKAITDSINPLASIIAHKKIGDPVKAGEKLFSFTHFEEAASQDANRFLTASPKISLQKTARPSLILKRVTL